MIHDEIENPLINFAWFKFIGRTKLALTNKETMRLTLREFNAEYKIYKDNFDLELCLSLNRMTYATLRKKQMQSEEWF